jgi:hypothetical protein
MSDEEGRVVLSTGVNQVTSNPVSIKSRGNPQKSNLGELPTSNTQTNSTKRGIVSGRVVGNELNSDDERVRPTMVVSRNNGIKQSESEPVEKQGGPQSRNFAGIVIDQKENFT